MTLGVIGWTAAVMVLTVAAVDLPRMRVSRGMARSAVGVEALMAAVMAFMALPATAAAFSGQFLWAGAFAVVGLGVCRCGRTRLGPGRVAPGASLVPPHGGLRYGLVCLPVHRQLVAM